jgi:hypothetical protein
VSHHNRSGASLRMTVLWKLRQIGQRLAQDDGFVGSFDKPSQTSL